MIEICDCGEEMIELGLIMADEYNGKYLYQCPKCKIVRLVYG